ncbi:sugar phosphate isomerase/epimerase family protein [Catalinimonas niigatensis]|uniref:sugar phosphate isomerase/epimerase family protein n=1 Tax=Catalinimonas niigatensis TaxID=1397264 RepID=UPI002665019F|nr:sugar phosphate isomerase/epimerase family protein [Catalinimonas niigatensis]WPP48236.1 sugar phosphate isomerase/epimerase family protein [Catalinimonas niigatensis]
MKLSRRHALASLGAVAGSAFLSSCETSASEKTETVVKPAAEKKANFTYCLNTSTIRESKLGLIKEIETAAEAGYDGIEVWIPTMQAYLDGGGKLSEVRKRIDDLGIKVEDAIGFAQWIVDDPAVRKAAFEQAKREMDMLSQIGCPRIAAPPAGATEKAGLDLLAAADRYAQLLELGEQMEVMPQLEVWGFSANLHRLGQTTYVAMESGHSKARILPDVYHLYKGGTDFTALQMLSGEAIEVFHMNDYPANPPRETMADKDRVYPGDGIAPLDQILQTLASSGTPKVLSLELFNPEYWKQDPLVVAKTGLEKMKSTVQSAMKS